MAFTVLCNHHFHLVPEHLYHPKENPTPFETPQPWPLATAFLLSIRIGFPTPEIPCEWRRTMCGLSRLAHGV